MTLARTTSALLGAALAAAPAAQPLLPNSHDGLMPFRSPQQNVEAPQDLFRDLQLMVSLVENPGEYEVHFDEDGREVCTNPIWQRTREIIKGKMFNMAALFGIVLRDSRHTNDRKLAAYGTFYVDKVSDIFELIAFLPGEPAREIREPAFRRAIGFLRVHWPQDQEVDPEAPVDPDYPTPPLYRLDAGPFLALLDLDDPRDQAQGLWFLKELCVIRPDTAGVLLGHAEPRLRRLLQSDDRIVHAEAREFLHWADPKHREPPPADAGAEVLMQWLDAVMYDVFPPIRRVNKGRVDLYPSDDLTRIIADGQEALRGQALGRPTSGQRRDGTPFRGFKLQRLPAPLDKLRLPLDCVILSISGTSVATGEDILTAIEARLRHGKSLQVEYQLGERVHMMEYHVQP